MEIMRLDNDKWNISVVIWDSDISYQTIMTTVELCKWVLPLVTSGFIAALLVAAFCWGNPDRTHRPYISYQHTPSDSAAGMLLHCTYKGKFTIEKLK